jgi:hypothetical protein
LAERQRKDPYPFFTFHPVVSFTNRSRFPISFAHCLGPPYFTVVTLDDKPAVYNLPVACGETPDLVVKPGETRTDTLNVGGPSDWSESVQALPASKFTGPFRLVFSGRVNGEEPALFVSEPFTVSVPR